MKKRGKINPDNYHKTSIILSIIFIVFISLFALDVFSEYLGLKSIVALFMRLIPSFILIVILLIAIKWKQIGGLIFILIGLLYIALTYQRASQQSANFYFAYLTISLPLIIIGILFLLSSRKKK